MRAVTHKKIRGLAASTAGLLVLGLQIDAGISAPALAVPNQLSSTVAPGSVIAGSTNTFAYTTTNTSGATGSLLTLGSIQVTSPANWGAPTNVTPPAGWTIASASGNSFCLTGSNGGLTPGQAMTVSFNDLAQSSAGSGQFTTTGFVGTNCTLALGDVAYTGAAPAVTVDTLVYSVHSTSGNAGQAITPGFTLTAKKSDGSTDSAFTGPIALAFGAKPTSTATLSGNGPTNASSGSASFTPTISAAGAGYTLLASSNGSPGVASEPIYVTGTSGASKSVACQPNTSCDTGVVKPAGNSTTAAEAIGAAGPSSDVLSLAVGDKPAAACAGSSLPSPAPLDVFVGDFNRHITLKVTYDRDRDNDPFSGFTKALTPTSAAWKKVCFQGSSDPAPHLLAKCTATDANGFGTPEPCIQGEFAEPDDTSSTADILTVLSLNPDPDPHVINGLI
jgi:hypothetical protein